MVVGHGRGAGQVGRGGRSTERGGSSTGPSAGEKTEAEKIKSGATRIRGSYRYHKHGVVVPPAFAKRESDRYRSGRASSPSAALSSSSSRQRPLAELVVKMEEDDTEPTRLPQPQFVPRDYLDDEKLKLVLPQLSVNAGFAPGDFVEERDLDTVVGLVSRSSQSDADKADEWRCIAEEHGRMFVDLGSDTE